MPRIRIVMGMAAMLVMACDGPGTGRPDGAPEAEPAPAPTAVAETDEDAGRDKDHPPEFEVEPDSGGGPAMPPSSPVGLNTKWRIDDAPASPDSDASHLGTRRLNARLIASKELQVRPCSTPGGPPPEWERTDRQVTLHVKPHEPAERSTEIIISSSSNGLSWRFKGLKHGAMEDAEPHDRSEADKARLRSDFFGRIERMERMEGDGREVCGVRGITPHAAESPNPRDRSE